MEISIKHGRFMTRADLISHTVLFCVMTLVSGFSLFDTLIVPILTFPRKRGKERCCEFI
jgi:hypothetical protein